MRKRIVTTTAYRRIWPLVDEAPEEAGPSAEVYLVYPEELRSSQRIMVFRDFLLRSISQRRK